MLLFLLAACGIDNTLKDPADADPGFVDDSGLDVPVDTDSAAADELCNGVDDDGDGQVDEGWPDDDGNGRADCVDETCPDLAVVHGGPVDPAEDCDTTVTPPTNPFDVDVEWTFDELSTDASYDESLVPPLVAELTDDDGDGDVDDADTPDVVTVIVSYPDATVGQVVVLDGRTGAEELVVPDVSGVTAPTVGDVDGDGDAELVTVDRDHHVVAYAVDGTLEWTSTVTPDFDDGVVVTAGDLDEDGEAEIVAANYVVEGLDGRERFHWTADYTYTTPVIADLDLDGHQELLTDAKVFDSDGTLLWSVPLTGIVSWPVVLQADGDDEAEVGWLADTWTLHEADGTTLVDSTDPYTRPGPPCVADFDGDGEPEVAWASGTGIAVHELDGRASWDVLSRDASGFGGCSAFDLDADGDFELLYADETEMRILDGQDGAVLYTDTDHASRTEMEYPTVADVDGDGHAEVLYASSTLDDVPPYALTVLGHDGAGWPAAARGWGTHTYTGTNVESDGHIPVTPEPSWLGDDLFRAAAIAPPTQDLRVFVVDACVADCTYGPAVLEVQVENAGTTSVPAGTPLAIYAERDDGSVLVATAALPEVPAGTSLDGMTFEFTPDQIGTSGFTVVVDDDGTGAGTVDECHEDDNSDVWQPVCD